MKDSTNDRVEKHCWALRKNAAPARALARAARNTVLREGGLGASAVQLCGSCPRGPLGETEGTSGCRAPEWVLEEMGGLLVGQGFLLRDMKMF